MNEQIPTATIIIATVVPVPIPACFTVISKSPIVRSFLSYHGPSGTTTPFQSTLVTLALGTSLPLFFSASFASYDAIIAPAVLGLQ